MNFFKSIFSDDDPEPPKSESASQTVNNAPQNKEEDDPGHDSPPIEHGSDLNVNPSPDPYGAGGWNLGGLMRTWTTKSESIIETYRRDLQEFGSGLKKEIEVAQGSLGTVGHAFDEFGNSVVKGTTQIISQGKDVILAASLESDSDNGKKNDHKYSSEKSLNSRGYSRFDAQVRAIQGDASTYEEPEDLNDYDNWKSEFSLDGKSEEFESFLRANDAMESIYKRVVPNSVDHETFWYRYYYKVSKLKKAEDVRARLVNGMSCEEEDLSWDFEDDEGDKEYEGKTKPDLMNNKKVDGEDLGRTVDAELQVGRTSTSNEGGVKSSNVEEVHNLGEEESTVERRDNLLHSKELGNKTDNKSVEEPKVENSEVAQEMGDESKGSIKEAASNSEGGATVNKNESAAESDEKLIVERKADDGKSSVKNNDSSLVSSQHSTQEEEDLGWDEIEDLSSLDEKKATESGSLNKVDLRKRLSAAEEDVDLSWDIEDDDDEPARA